MVCGFLFKSPSTDPQPYISLLFTVFFLCHTSLSCSTKAVSIHSDYHKKKRRDLSKQCGSQRYGGDHSRLYSTVDHSHTVRVKNLYYATILAVFVTFKTVRPAERVFP